MREKDLQAAIMKLLRAHRVHVSVLGTVRRRPWCRRCRASRSQTLCILCGQTLAPAHLGTQQTEGLPDLWLMYEDPQDRCPDLAPTAAWVELKQRHGAVSADQREWHRMARAAGIDVQVWRSIDDALAWLVGVGLRRAA